jgi:hypothetical protein
MSMYRDAGEKNPENFVKVDQGMPPELQKAQQMLQALQAENQQLKQGAAVDMAKINKDFEAKMSAVQAEVGIAISKISSQEKIGADKLMMQLKEIHAEMGRTHEMHMQDLRHQAEKQQQAINVNVDSTGGHDATKQHPLEKVAEKLDATTKALTESHSKLVEQMKKPKTRKVTTPDGRVYTAQDVG